jgi:DNA-binding response OmpR family regulator
MRVLVIEDDMDTAESMALVLHDLRHEVEFALTGKSGLSVARRFRPEVVFLDIGLPDVSGIGGKLRREAGVPAATIIAIMGKTGLGDRERALQAGCDYYVRKPVDPALIEGLLKTKRS